MKKKLGLVWLGMLSTSILFFAGCAKEHIEQPNEAVSLTTDYQELVSTGEFVLEYEENFGSENSMTVADDSIMLLTSMSNQNGRLDIVNEKQKARIAKCEQFRDTVIVQLQKHYEPILLEEWSWSEDDVQTEIRWHQYMYTKESENTYHINMYALIYSYDAEGNITFYPAYEIYINTDILYDENNEETKITFVEEEISWHRVPVIYATE